MDAESTTSTVIVVRGDIVRRYPTAHYFLQAAALDGEEATPVEGAPAVEATFIGALDRDTVFFGFAKGAGRGARRPAERRPRLLPRDRGAGRRAAARARRREA